MFERAAWALVDQHRRDTNDPGAGFEATARSLATTLTVALVRTESAEVRVAAVGDSPALVLREGEFKPIVGEPANSDGLLATAVDALPSGAGLRSTADCNLEPDSIVLLCTDGLALPLGDGRGDLGHAIAKELASPPDVIDFARLLDFSRATYDDDRTLVAVWPARESPP